MTLQQVGAGKSICFSSLMTNVTNQDNRSVLTTSNANDRIISFEVLFCHITILNRPRTRLLPLLPCSPASGNATTHRRHLFGPNPPQWKEIRIVSVFKKNLQNTNSTPAPGSSPSDSPWQPPTRSKWATLRREIWQYRYIYAMLALPLAFFIIFRYVPM